MTSFLLELRDQVSLQCVDRIADVAQGYISQNDVRIFSLLALSERAVGIGEFR